MIRTDLKEIHDNYYDLKGYNLHALSISMPAGRNRIAIFYSLMSNRRDQDTYLPGAATSF